LQMCEVYGIVNNITSIIMREFVQQLESTWNHCW
jgi:hypothetical protein